MLDEIVTLRCRSHFLDVREVQPHLGIFGVSDCLPEINGNCFSNFSDCSHYVRWTYLHQVHRMPHVIDDVKYRLKIVLEILLVNALLERVLTSPSNRHVED